MGFRAGSLVTAILISLLIPIGAVALLRQYDGFGMWAGVSRASWIYLALWYAAFFASMLMPGQNAVARIGRISNHNGWVIILSFVSTIGAAFLTYEFVVVRGYDPTMPITDIRVLQSMRADDGFVGSWLGGAGRLCYSALPVAWIVACTFWRSIRWPAIVLLLVSSACVFAFQIRFEGGRFFAVALTLSALFGCLSFFINDTIADGRIALRKVRFRHLAPFALLCVMMFGVSMYSAQVFDERGAYVSGKIDTIIIQDRERIAQVTAILAETIAESEGTSNPARAAKIEVQKQSLQAAVAAAENIEAAQEAGASSYALSYFQYASAFFLDTSKIARVASLGADWYRMAMAWIYVTVGSSRVDLQACKLEYSIVSPK